MGNVFKDLRERLGMTQHQAGLAIHKTQAAVSKIERGDPRWSDLEKLAGAKGFWITPTLGRNEDVT